MSGCARTFILSGREERRLWACWQSMRWQHIHCAAGLFMLIIDPPTFGVVPISDIYAVSLSSSPLRYRVN